jgi:hypothetical protein
MQGPRVERLADVAPGALEGPGPMDDFILLSRSLIALGLTLLLALLRVDAQRFGTAEYYEITGAGERPRLRRRLAWYGLGLGIAILILTIHPDARTVLFLGTGDRLGAVLGGVAFGAIGVAAAGSPVSHHRSACRRRARTRAPCSTRPPRRSSTRSRSAARSSGS